MIYIIDHQDSFTWNVVHQFSEFDNVICNNILRLIMKNYVRQIQLCYRLALDLQKIFQ